MRRNYGFEKRQKELARLKKQEEKRRRRAERGRGEEAAPDADLPTEPLQDAPPTE
jgi:hypothetical protein